AEDGIRDATVTGVQTCALPISGRGAGSGDGNGPGNGGDLRASCASCPIPEYPARARREGWQGTVDVDLRLGPDGAVEEASIGRRSEERRVGKERRSGGAT